MKYFIGHLISGSAREYHHDLCIRLSELFDIRYLPDTIPSHVTLKAPFDAAEISGVEAILDGFSREQKKPKIKLEGIGHFNNRVIFIDSKPSNEMVEMHKRLFSKLKQLNWMKFGDFEGDNAHFHVTVASKGIEDKFDKLWIYAKKENPSFELDVDNISILKHENGRWKVYRQYNLQ